MYHIYQYLTNAIPWQSYQRIPRNKILYSFLCIIQWKKMHLNKYANFGFRFSVRKPAQKCSSTCACHFFKSIIFFYRFPKVCDWAEHYDKKKSVSKSNFGVVLLIPCRTVWGPYGKVQAIRKPDHRTMNNEHIVSFTGH